jgi:hypothetical protein
LKPVIEGTPQSSFETVDAYLDIARRTPDRNLRLTSITQALETLRSFRAYGLYALPPYPSILHELYQYYLDGKAYGIALSLLLFMHRHCLFYSYPQLNHSSNVQRIFTMVKLCACLMPSPDDEDNVCGKASDPWAIT